MQLPGRGETGGDQTVMTEWMTLYGFLVWIPMAAGFVLDALFGDPLSGNHPVVWIGRLISLCDRFLRKGKGDLFTGFLTVIIVCFFSSGIPSLVLYLLYVFAGKIVSCIAASLLCWQMIAARDLVRESMKVFYALEQEDLPGAIRAVSMIVGRDTASLDEKGVIRAAVETVAENTSDGVTAPLFYMALLGIPGIFFYKAVNTMDSMIGYKNEKYLFFGRTAAKLDDVLNFLPARITAVFMTAAAFLLPGNDGAAGFRMFLRDRKKSSSPNAGCTEAVTAGALHIQLLGPAFYFGKRVEKPFIGNPDREPEKEDIRRACVLMYATSVLMLAGLLAVPTLWRIFG